MHDFHGRHAHDLQQNNTRSRSGAHYRPSVITGSTDGIGKHYAFQLASRGLNVVLVSRSTEKLVAVAQEIESKYSVKTKWIAIDFSSGREIYDQLRKELDTVPVGILGKRTGGGERT